MPRVVHRLGPAVRLTVAAALALALAAGWVAAPPVSDAASSRLPAWDGSIDLYRAGTFTTQKTWLWCTAADVQIIRNIVRGERDHSTSGQRRYFNWMREHNRYDLPLSAGVDPQGWTAGLRHFVDDRYRLVASNSFEAALRSAVTNLRKTNLPVGVTVAHGGHAWILTGFAATADPLKTTSFKVTSVRVVGPLYGLQSKNGYDMPPDTKLTPAQFKGFFTAWKYAPKRMIWDGLYVSIQPIPKKAAAVTPPSPAVSVAPTPSVAPVPSPSASTVTPTVPPGAITFAGRPPGSQRAQPADAAVPADPPSSAQVMSTTSSIDGSGPILTVVVLSAALAALALTIGVARARRPGRPRGTVRRRS